MSRAVGQCVTIGDRLIALGMLLCLGILIVASGPHLVHHLVDRHPRHPAPRDAHISAHGLPYPLADAAHPAPRILASLDLSGRSASPHIRWPEPGNRDGVPGDRWCDPIPPPDQYSPPQRCTSTHRRQQPTSSVSARQEVR